MQGFMDMLNSILTLPEPRIDKKYWFFDDFHFFIFSFFHFLGEAYFWWLMTNGTWPYYIVCWLPSSGLEIVYLTLVRV